MTFGFPKPAKGSGWLARKQRRADLLADEHDEKQAVRVGRMNGFLRRLYRALLPERPAPVKWQPTGYRYTATGHDESKAREVFKAEQRQAAKARARAAKAIAEAQAVTRRATVTPIRRKA